MSDITVAVLGTVVLFLLSAGLAVALALLLALGSLARQVVPRAAAETVITLTRGVPTSLLVVAGGVSALGNPPPEWLPDVFPGTSAAMTLVAWAVTGGVALGSAGHFAVIFRTGYHAVNLDKREQMAVLGLPGTRRLRLATREAAAHTLAPFGARLTHHLHNTAFAALFPVTDLLGWVEEGANGTFQVTRYIGVGVAVYVVLSFLVWLTCRSVEYRIVRRDASGHAGRAREVAA